MRRRAAHAFRFAMLDASTTLSRALAFWRETALHSLAFGGGTALICGLVVYIPALLINGTDSEIPGLVVWIARLLIMVVVAGMMFPLLGFVAARRYNGEFVPLEEIWAISAESRETRILSTIMLILLTVLCFGPAVLMFQSKSDGLRVAAVIIAVPAGLGVYGMVLGRKALTPVIAVLEELGFSEASRRSSYLSKSARGTLFGLVFRMVLLSQLLALPFTASRIILIEWLDPQPLLLTALELGQLVIWGTTFCVTAHALTLFYFSQRCAWEGLDIASISVAFHAEIERDTLERYIAEGYYGPGLSASEVIPLVYRSQSLSPNQAEPMIQKRHFFAGQGARKW